MNDVLALPTGPLADASLALVRSTESRPIADHSIRSFIFARLLAEHEASASFPGLSRLVAMKMNGPDTESPMAGCLTGAR
jgi:hypothetical protein